MGYSNKKRVKKSKYFITLQRNKTQRLTKLKDQKNRQRKNVIFQTHFLGGFFGLDVLLRRQGVLLDGIGLFQL